MSRQVGKHPVRGILAGAIGGIVAAWIMNQFITGAGPKLQEAVQSNDENKQSQEQQEQQKQNPQPDATMKTSPPPKPRSSRSSRSSRKRIRSLTPP